MWRDLNFQPGVYLDDTPLAAKPRYADANLAYFRLGKPESWRGWAKFVEDQMLGKCRGAFEWADNSGRIRWAFGTNVRLYVLSEGALYNITPIRAEGTLGNDPFQTLSGSSVVEVTQGANGVRVGDIVTFSGATEVGGIDMNGEWEVVEVIDDDHYDVETNQTATSTTSGGGASVEYVYEINSGYADSIGQGGYGIGGYGVGAYSLGDTSEDIFIRTWSLDQWGEYLVANPRGDTIYQWELDTSQRAVAIANAPAQVTFMLVTPEQFMMAFGCTNPDTAVFEPNLVAWSDQADNTVWTSATTNQAGNIPVAAGSRLVGARKTPTSILAWTDTALFVGRYGQTFGYTFQLAGESCGLIGPNGATVVGSRAVWVGTQRNFYYYDGGAVTPLPSSVRDWFFTNLSPGQEDKIYSGLYPEHNSILFFFPGPSGENDLYAEVGIAETWWSKGEIGRTAWIGTGPFGQPFGVSADSYIMIHEQGTTDEAGDAIGWYWQTSKIELGQGAQNMDINGFMLDIHSLAGTVQLTAYTYLESLGDATTNGPYSVTEGGTGVIDCRVDGKQAAFRLTGSSSDSYARLGIDKVDLQVQGDRR